MTAPTLFSIGDVVERTGVAEATLRMWERRYGFPSPKRLTSGHRRYNERDVELIRAVVARRAAGLALEQPSSRRVPAARSRAPPSTRYCVGDDLICNRAQC